MSYPAQSWTHFQLNRIDRSPKPVATKVEGVDYSSPSLIYISGQGDIDMQNITDKTANFLNTNFQQPALGDHGQKLYYVNMGENPPPSDNISRERTDFNKSPESYTSDTAKELVKCVFAPALDNPARCKDVNASLQKTKKAFSTITLVGFCHGSVLINETANALQAEMKQRGYQDRQISDCMNCISALHLSPAGPIVDRKSDIPSINAFMSVICT